MNTNRLLFEGVDDKHVVKNLLFNHGLDIFDYKEKEGIDKLLKTLQEEVEATDWTRLGIIVDADFDVQAQWSSVTRILLPYAIDPIPSAPAILFGLVRSMRSRIFRLSNAASRRVIFPRPNCTHGLPGRKRPECAWGRSLGRITLTRSCRKPRPLSIGFAGCWRKKNKYYGKYLA
jgi:hypothetical protein